MGDERSARNGHVHVVLDQAGCFAAWKSRRFSMKISRASTLERSSPGCRSLEGLDLPGGSRLLARCSVGRQPSRLQRKRLCRGFRPRGGIPSGRALSDVLSPRPASHPVFPPNRASRLPVPPPGTVRNALPPHSPPPRHFP